jgi:hypothetical protein
MNKLKSFPWPALLLIFPILAIVQVSGNNEQIQTETTTQPFTWLSADSVTYYMDSQCADLNIWSTSALSMYAFSQNPDLYKSMIPKCAFTKFQWEELSQTNTQIAKENEMNQNAIIALSWVTVISILVLCVYAYFRRRHIDDHTFAQAKEERQYNLQVKEIELNQTIKLQQAELERYKTLELSKTQMDNEHEVALKKLEFDKSIDARDFMLNVTKDEREYLLKQRGLDIQEGKSSPSFMDVIDSNKDVQLRLKK